MNEVTAPKLTLPDRIRGWWDSDYAARVTLNRYVTQRPWRYAPHNSARRSSDATRTDSGWTGQPWGTSGTRTLTSASRKNMVRRARQIDENNILGSAMLDRAVDNVIGEGMVLQAKTNSKSFNKKVESLWREYEPDARGMMSKAELQRAWKRAEYRDGDFGVLLLKSGTVQSIESDYIQSPFAHYEQRHNPNIIDGVEVNAVGRPRAFHLSTLDSGGNASSVRVRRQNMLWCAKNNRFNREAVRGVSVLAELGPMLDQIDGTTEAVVVAHRMAAIFGIIHQRKNPAAAYGSLPTTATNAGGDDVPEISLEPGMYQYAGIDDNFTQIKAEHPTQSFSDLMTYLIRMAGIKLGLPLELAMLDFSRTNYSSARASMEQSYRSFRTHQNRFAQSILTPLYRWRVSKWIKEGRLPDRSDAFAHNWLGQPWPYLDPQKEAVGSLVAIDGGLSTLPRELAKRGIEFADWIEESKMVADRKAEAGITTSKSNMTRDEGEAAPAPGGDDDEE